MSSCFLHDRYKPGCGACRVIAREQGVRMRIAEAVAAEREVLKKAVLDELVRRIEADPYFRWSLLEVAMAFAVAIRARGDK
jgi:hypothetical protein